MDANVISRDLDQAEARKAAGDVRLGAVDGDPATHRHSTQRAMLYPFPVLDSAIGGRSVVDSPMVAEMVRAFRVAMALQIDGAGDIDQRQLTDRPCDQSGIVERSDAQHAIDAVLDQVHRAIGDAKVDINLRIEIEKFWQRRCDDEPSNAARDVDP